MGKYIKGIPGSFSGHVGAVVGSSWKGIEVMKSRIKPSKKPITARQIAQRAWFSFVGAFIKPLSKLFDIACRYIYRHTLTGSDDEFKTDYAKIMISLGDLHPSGNAVAEVMDNTIKFSWKGVLCVLLGTLRVRDDLSLRFLAIRIRYHPEELNGLLQPPG